jgi:hypothetical protein
MDSKEKTLAARGPYALPVRGFVRVRGRGAGILRRGRRWEIQRRGNIRR